MLVGITMSVLGGEVGVVVSELTGEAASAQTGIGFAFVMSIIYLILGAWLGKQMKPK